MTGTDGDHAEIAAIRAALEAAENAFDADAAAALLTEDAVFMVPDYPVQQGKAACTAFMRDVMGWLQANVDRRVSYASDEVMVLGDAAVDRGTFSFTVCPKARGGESSVTGKYFWLLRKSSGRWAVARLAVVRDSEGEEGGDE